MLCAPPNKMVFFVRTLSNGSMIIGNLTIYTGMLKKYVAFGGLMHKASSGKLCALHWTFIMLRVGITLESKRKATFKLSDPIDRDQDSRPKEFTLGFGSKVWQDEVTIMYHHFQVDSHQSQLRNMLLVARVTNLQAWKLNIELKNKVHYRVFWTPSFLHLDPNIHPSVL